MRRLEKQGNPSGRARSNIRIRQRPFLNRASGLKFRQYPIKAKSIIYKQDKDAPSYGKLTGAQLFRASN